MHLISQQKTILQFGREARYAFLMRYVSQQNYWVMAAMPPVSMEVGGGGGDRFLSPGKMSRPMCIILMGRYQFIPSSLSKWQLYGQTSLSMYLIIYRTSSGLCSFFFGLWLVARIGRKCSPLSDSCSHIWKKAALSRKLEGRQERFNLVVDHT